MAKKKRSSKAGSRSKSNVTVTTGVAEWRRYLTASVLGALAFALVGVFPMPGGFAARAVVAGLVVAMTARRSDDVAWLSASAALSAFAGLVLAVPWADSLAQTRVGIGELLTVLLTCSVVAAVGSWMRVRIGERWASVVAVALVCLVFLFGIGVLSGPMHATYRAAQQKYAVEPPAEGYQLDSYIYLKTSFLVDRGVPYYDALLSAFDGDLRLEGEPPGLLSVRQPWIYYFWRVLPGASGTKVLDWFAVFALGAGIAAFWGTKERIGDSAALTATSAVLGYMSLGAVTAWFPMSEYWAGALALGAVMAMLRRKPYLAAGLVVAAFAFREIAAWVMPVFAIWWFFSGERKKWWPALVVALGGPVALYMAHAMMSPVGGGTSGGLGSWLQASATTLLAALRFSGDLVPGRAFLYPLAAICAVVGAGLLRDRAEKAVALSAAVSVLVLLGAFSSGEWGDYWGAIGMPTLLALAFLVFGPFTSEEPDSFLLQPSPASRSARR